MCEVRNERYTARFESFACRLRVEQGWQLESVRHEHERLAMCGVIRRDFGNLSSDQSLEGNGTTQGHTFKNQSGYGRSPQRPAGTQNMGSGWAGGG